MCEPMTIAAMAAAGMAVGSSFMQYQSGSAQAKHQTQLADANKVSALSSMTESYQALGLRQQQEQDAASDNIQDRRLQGMKQTSAATVAAGEAGVSGFSVQRVLQDMGAMASRDVSSIEQNRDWSISQLGSQASGVRSNTQSRIASMQGGIKPNGWASAFKAGADGLSAYTSAGGTFGSGRATPAPIVDRSFTSTK